MTNPLRESLLDNQNVGEMMESNAMVDSYKTGFAALDYYLGFILDVFNPDNTIKESYPVLGINGGCFFTDIGNSSTAKTALMVGIAGNIVRPFDAGLIIHLDLEQAMNITRSKTLLKFTAEEMHNKYVLRQMQTTIEEIKILIMELYKEKTSNPKKYMYDSGKLDEFGNPIVMYQPTIVIIDSIPSLTVKLSETVSKEWSKLEEITSQTERMRMTGVISRFYTDVGPYLRAANIIVMGINHIKVNPNMGIIKDPADLLYLKQGETMPCGRAVYYYSHYMIKHVAIGSGKFNKEDDGFDGFLLRIEFIKSRSNQAGQHIELVYDKIKGFSIIRSGVHYAKENGLVGGNKNSMYFINNKDTKFSLRNAEESFNENRELYKIMYEHIVPLLKQNLSHANQSELNVHDEAMDY